MKDGYKDRLGGRNLREIYFPVSKSDLCSAQKLHTYSNHKAKPNDIVYICLCF